MNTLTYNLPFAKYHGTGNDMLIIEAESLMDTSAGRELLENWLEQAPVLAAQMCHRQFGIGADGLILSLDLKNPFALKLAEKWYGDQARQADFGWTYTNSDGSWSDMCGNGLRCLALSRLGSMPGTHTFTVATAAGLVKIDFHSSELIAVELAEPRLAPEQIPIVLPDLSSGTTHITRVPLTVKGGQVLINCVNVGNPHCIIMEPDPLKYRDDIKLPIDPQTKDYFPEDLVALAREIQAHPAFPEGVNVHFVSVKSRVSADCLVFERGCEATLASGSAALAVLVAGNLAGLLDRKAAITMPGGTVSVHWNETTNRLILEGPAKFVFQGNFEIALQPDALLTSAQGQHSK